MWDVVRNPYVVPNTLMTETLQEVDGHTSEVLTMAEAASLV